MDRLFDEAARILAGPMPRRRAVAVLGGALLAALLGTDASAQLTCPGGCPFGSQCCPGQRGANNFCILNSLICCGNSSCNSSLGETCCDGLCIPSGLVCCGNGNGHACNQNNELCCGTNCCNKSNTICCGNLNCCGPHACGTDGRCQISDPLETSQP